MAVHLSVNVIIDVPEVLNLAEHVDMAHESGVMNARDVERLVSEELVRFVRSA